MLFGAAIFIADFLSSTIGQTMATFETRPAGALFFQHFHPHFSWLGEVKLTITGPMFSVFMEQTLAVHLVVVSRLSLLLIPLAVALV